jgi:hypothetical protein
LPTWRCSRCNAPLGFDSWRWFAWVVSLIAAGILLVISHFIHEWLFWALVVGVSGVEMLWLPWFVSVVLKEEHGEKH